MRVLVVEDEDSLSQTLTRALGAAGFAVAVERDGDLAWKLGESESFDAVVLDLGLPSLDGLTVLRRWRSAGRLAPVLILSGRSHWEERVIGIEAGADDYVTKPFAMEEVVARVRALVRRASGLASSRVRFGGFVLDVRQMQVLEGGVPVDLTPLEYRLMAYLVIQRGRVVSQRDLTAHLYNQNYEPGSNAIEVLVGRVRRRLGSEVIATRRGFGYGLGVPVV